MLGKCDMVEFAQFVSIARRIWLRRREVVHGGPFMHPQHNNAAGNSGGNKFPDYAGRGIVAFNSEWTRGTMLMESPFNGMV